MSRSTRPLARRFLEVAPAALHALRGDNPLGATIGQLRCLYMLERQPHSLSELAARYGVSAPTMSRMITGMVERGWVSRAEAPEDRRQLVLTLLPPGEQALRNLHAKALDRLAALLEALTPDECAALNAGLDGLARVLQPARPRRA